MAAGLMRASVVIVTMADSGLAEKIMHHVQEMRPELPVVVLSASERTSDVLRSIDAGAMGFVSKRSSHVELIQALKTVMAGGLVIPQGMMQLQESPDGPAIPEAAHHPQSPTGPVGTPAVDAKAVLRKIGLKGAATLLVETTDDGAVILRPAAVYPIEIYSEARVKEFDAANRHTPAEKERVRKALSRRAR